jgi:hypothetical protein
MGNGNGFPIRPIYLAMVPKAPWPTMLLAIAREKFWGWEGRKWQKLGGFFSRYRLVLGGNFPRMHPDPYCLLYFDFFLVGQEFMA